VTAASRANRTLVGLTVIGDARTLFDRVTTFVLSAAHCKEL